MTNVLPEEIPDRLSPWGVFGLGCVHGLGCLLLMFVIYTLWPSDAQKGVHAAVFGLRMYVTQDRAILALVIAFGALGSYVHGATSFATYAGNKTLTSSWTWWYLLRPTIGAAIAVIFYLVVRGSLLTSSGTAGAINVYGASALAGLSGMFSKQAVDKMREVFETLFRQAKDKGDAERLDKVDPNKDATGASEEASTGASGAGATGSMGLITPTGATGPTGSSGP